VGNDGFREEWIIPLLVLAGLLLTNALVSFLLFWRERTTLHRALLLVWIAAILAIGVQGVITSVPECAFVFGIAVFGLNVLLADLVRRALSLPARWRMYFATFVVAFAASIVLYLTKSPFWAIALPLAIAVSLPPFDVTREAVRHPRPLSVPARSMLVAVVIYAGHELDYPFLRDKPWFVPYGFAIAIIAIFALSISAPAVILERTAAELRRLQSKEIERERLSALGEAAAVLAHEVRNPLGTMTNTIELLRKESLSDEGRELLSIQRAEIFRLDRLVADLLSFSKPLEPRIVDVEMRTLVRHAVRSVRADAESANVELTVEEGPERSVRADPDSIQLALMNVLKNAIQASPAGGTVRVALAHAADGVHVTIDDEGAGVPANVIADIFKPFVTTRATGSGLGLAILDRVMRAHGGHVHVENLPERGARFELVFANPSRPLQ
jgi:signal transduction histidine kinase